MKKLFSKLAVICVCAIVACMSFGFTFMANGASSDPQIISKIVTLPANNQTVTMGQCRKTFVTSSDHYSTIIAEKTSSNGFSTMTVRLYRVQTNGTVFFLSGDKTIAPSSSQQKITYISGLKYEKNDGIRFVGKQAASTSKGADVTLYGN